MLNDDHVCDGELLYRKVPDQKGIHYKPISDGNYRVTSAAFEDKQCWQPSVDRAKLRDYKPEKSKKKPTDLIISFTAGEVRGITGFSRVIDVVPDPKPKEDPENIAHALIIADRQFPSKTQFQKFTRALARIADSNWEIAPPDSA